MQEVNDSEHGDDDEIRSVDETINGGAMQQREKSVDGISDSDSETSSEEITDDDEDSDDDIITPKMKHYVSKLVATVTEGDVATRLLDFMGDMLGDLVTPGPTTPTKRDKGKKKRSPKKKKTRTTQGLWDSLMVRSPTRCSNVIRLSMGLLNLGPASSRRRKPTA
jgi:hypothetical protein